MSFYPWMDRTVEKNLQALDSQAAGGPLKKTLKEIDRLSVDAGVKNCMAAYALQNAAGTQGSLLASSAGTWKNSKAFGEFVVGYLQEKMTAFRISGMMSVMTGTLVFYFLNAVLRQSYVISFSVDAIVGAVAFAFWLMNMLNMARMCRQFGSASRFWLLAGLDLLLCFLFRLWIPPQFDVSLVILLVGFFFEKRLYGQMQQRFESTIPACVRLEQTGKKKSLPAAKGK